ncbi:tyrosine-type recombinase/integrase [Desulfopila aestuarii]|uniref:Site-specific recombinase XerD n=1 Tax=Desulfopila aestuarii DSM 18488 TaxID=1121416 RepID=A0A1M7XWU4_9BACT|nr:tyrosine-type recombinase/integrase [Desulfopila aestuarii]SHO43281.1 Site-specific recombinase XerD [Desulfopila aestuarii DSM 18488]
MSKITSKLVSSARPSSSEYFIRDSELKGFALRVFPSGTIKYLAEVWHEGKSHRKTLGSHPVLTLQDARKQALAFIRDVQSGQREESRKAKVTLGDLFKDYTKGDRLKPGTLKNHTQVVRFYLKDWIDKPVTSITKEMVEKLFFQIRDYGVHEGKPTYSQATKTMRILSALMNYACADELIENNPVTVLKLKRIDRSIIKREHYLKAEEVRRLLQVTRNETHPMTLAVHLMLYTGLRKNEALRLKWEDIETVNDVSCIVIRDTKNCRPHYLPITPVINEILKKASNGSMYVFSSPQHSDRHLVDERPTLKRLSKAIGVVFKCHDLRRTFATRASEAGVDFLMVKRLLNHKSNDITAQYIQWNSKQNLLVMRDALARVEY